MAAIPGIKLICHNAGGVNNPDDPSYPWRLDATLQPPEFMNMAFIFLHSGQEVICVRGQTQASLEEFVAVNNLRNHPRLVTLTITDTSIVQSSAED